MMFRVAVVSARPGLALMLELQVHLHLLFLEIHHPA